MVVVAGRAARVIDGASDEDMIGLQEASLRWARAHSWTVMADVWRAELERVAS
jgi:hypothetical protein